MSDGIRLHRYLWCKLTHHSCDPDGYVDTQERVSIHECRRCGALLEEPYEIVSVTRPSEE